MYIIEMTCLLDFLIISFWVQVQYFGNCSVFSIR